MINRMNAAVNVATFVVAVIQEEKFTREELVNSYFYAISIK